METPVNLAVTLANGVQTDVIEIAPQDKPHVTKLVVGAGVINPNLLAGLTNLKELVLVGDLRPQRGPVAFPSLTFLHVFIVSDDSRKHLDDVFGSVEMPNLRRLKFTAHENPTHRAVFDTQTIAFLSAHAFNCIELEGGGFDDLFTNLPSMKVREVAYASRMPLELSMLERLWTMPNVRTLALDMVVFQFALPTNFIAGVCKILSTPSNIRAFKLCIAFKSEQLFLPVLGAILGNPNIVYCVFTVFGRVSSTAWHKDLLQNRTMKYLDMESVDAKLISSLPPEVLLHVERQKMVLKFEGHHVSRASKEAAITAALNSKRPDVMRLIEGSFGRSYLEMLRAPGAKQFARSTGDHAMYRTIAEMLMPPPTSFNNEPEDFFPPDERWA